MSDTAPTLAALRLAIGHIEHLAAWIGAVQRGEARGLYSFEALGEDMQGIRQAACLTCDGRGEIGGWDGGDNAWRTERCPECSA